MNTQALQHQDELEKQQLVLSALKRLWWLDIDGEDGGDADAFLIADALGVLDEFKYTLALEVEK